MFVASDPARVVASVCVASCLLAVGCGAMVPVIGPFDTAGRRMARHDYAGAEREYSEAIRESPENCRCWNGRASARLDLEDFAGAFEDADRAIQLDPKYSKAYASRAFARTHLLSFGASRGEVAAVDVAGGIADFTKVIEIEKQPALVAEALIDRSRLLALQGEYDRALLDADAAAKMDHHPYESRSVRAYVCVLRGDESGALALVESLRQESPKYAAAIERDLQQIRAARMRP